MKITLSIVFALLAIGKIESAGLSCQIDSSLQSGTNNVVFTLSPTPLEALDAAGLGDSKSPLAILNLLQSAANPANALGQSISTAISSAFTKLFPFPPLNKINIPSCRFQVLSSQLFCDNVNSAFLTPLCATFSAITNITKPISFPIPDPTNLNQPPLACEVNTPHTWGVQKINAPNCWAQGFNGSGVVVAISIAEYDPPMSNSRTTCDLLIIDDFVWGQNRLQGHFEVRLDMSVFQSLRYNPYNTSNTLPVDTNGHGSHTMGSMVGKTVGVAPGAQWIACKGCDGTSCDDEELLACAQFLICPDLKAKNCTTYPNIINNSWGGGIGNTFFNSVLVIMKRIGILNFFASGNSGPVCSTVKSPADGNGTANGFMSIGATSCDDKIASFSSVGPSQAADYLAGLGINVVGPGINVLSAWNTNDTATNIFSGTSMSSPHVAGAAAVLLSKNLKLNITQVATAMQGTAYQNPNVTNSLQACGGPNTNAAFPNNIYGFGRIDTFAALQTISSA